MKNKKQTIIAIILILISVLMIIASTYYKQNYKEQTFDNIIYHVLRGPEKANTEVVGKAFKKCAIPLVLLSTLFILPLTNVKNKIKFFPKEKIENHKIKYALLILSVSFLFALGQIGVYSYMVRQSQKSKIFENEYVASENVKIDFPEKKRNLIYIFLESMETSTVSKENGGGWAYSIIPELEQLAIENINFSGTEKLGRCYVDSRN